MARLRRQIGIRSAEVRLPRHESIGPALVKTASTAADAAFAKQSDIRTQEAQVAAAALNFERDGDGNLTAPSLPLSENGLLAPSIYDRAYTQMVSTKYLNQTKIDTTERLNTIATDNRFDPQAYKIIAEAYVAKVTELAPDMLKPDVNQSAQVTMVEHYNRIIRQTAERDHAEAHDVQLSSINTMSDDLTGYIEADASDEVVNAQVMKIRAAIAEGRDVREGGFGFWNDATEAEMMRNVDKNYVVANLVAGVADLPDDPLAHAEALKALNDFALGEATIELVDALGETYRVPVTDVYPNPDDRQMIAGHITSVLNTKQAVFENLLDERLKRDALDFFNVYSPMFVKNKGVVDMDFLAEEYKKAHFNVMNRGYDDSLRETIRVLMDQQLNSNADGRMPQDKQDFLAGFEPWRERYVEEYQKRLAGRDPANMTPDELAGVEHFARMTVGNVPGGNKQTAGSKRWIGEIYTGMTGELMTQPFFEDFIAGEKTEQEWSQIEWDIDTTISKVGIWPQELSNALIGKINAPEGMNDETLRNTFRLARMFWDNPTFRNNMTDENALGSDVGGVLDHIFRFGGERSPARVAKLLENYSDPKWSPLLSWNARSPEDRQNFNDAAQAAIRSHFVSDWKSLWAKQGKEVSGFGFNPLDYDLAGIPDEVMQSVMASVQNNAGFIDVDDKDSFGPFISRSVRETLHEKGYSTSQMGYSQKRHGNQFNFSFPGQMIFGDWIRPDSAIVFRPPEYYATPGKDGEIDQKLMSFVWKDFQKMLDEHGKPIGENWIVDENAALNYSGQASSAFGYPVWDIYLILADGQPELLTNSNGDRILFDMRGAEKQREDQKLRESNAIVWSTGKTRTSVQEGSIHFTNPGSAQ